jgi:predicted RNase H-like HicB family nuclease
LGVHIVELPVAIHRDKGTAYGVIVPDVPGCYSWGESISEALTNAREAIHSHFETLGELGEDFGALQASDIDELRENPEFEGAIWAVVSIDPADLDSTPERVNISVPRFALRRIDRFISHHHDSRSGFLIRAALNELDRERESNRDNRKHPADF